MKSSMKLPLGIVLFGSFIILAISSIAPVKAYAEQTLDWSFTDDFEGEEQSLDAYDPNYVLEIQTTNSNITIDQDESYSGTSSMQIYDDHWAAWSYVYATRSLPERTNGLFRYATKVSSDMKMLTQVALLNTNQDKTAAAIGFVQAPAYLSGAEAIYFYNETVMVDSGLDFTPNTWYAITISFDTETSLYSSWIDGGEFDETPICINASFYDASTWTGEPIGAFMPISFVVRYGTGFSAWYDEIRYGTEPIPTPPETPINIPEVVNVPKAISSPDIDGEISLDEYDGGAYIEFEIGSMCGNPENSVIIYSVYDDRYLYIGIDVLYDESQNDGKEGDLIVLALDLDNDHLLNESTDAGFFYLDTDTLELQGIADGEGAYGFATSNRSGELHRIWEFSIDRDILPDVKTKLGVFVYGIASVCESKVAGYAYPPEAMNDTGIADLSESNLNISNFAHWRLTAQPAQRNPSSNEDNDNAKEKNINTDSPVLLGSIGMMGVSGAVLATRQSIMAVASKMVAFSAFSISSAVVAVGFIAGWFLK